jgi:predicted nucleotidyltransferase component of viral defense system
MINTRAISSVLHDTIVELGDIESVHNYSFALGGGTNLALRYNHRVSKDIDLFCPELIGFRGFEKIERDLIDYYKKDIISLTYPSKLNDQFIFSRVLINKGSEFIKLELIQNTKNVKEIEVNKSITMLSVLDIGIMKLIAVADRMTKKDVYDLYLITDKIPLPTLFAELKNKQEKYNKPLDKSIFELNDNNNPVLKPQLLLAFDTMEMQSNKLKPDHLQNTLDIVSGSKGWHQARSS